MYNIKEGQNVWQSVSLYKLWRILGVSKAPVNKEGYEIRHRRFIGMENFRSYT